jgi:GGDEF domain-containing protein
MFSMDLKDMKMWLSAPLVSLLKLDLDQLDIDQYKALIYKEDLEKRQEVIQKLDEHNPSYEITYRIHVGNSYKWIREKGKKVTQDKALDIIMGAMYEVKTKHFMNSDIPTLDEISTYHHIHGFMNKKKLENKFFEVLYVKLHNLPSINDKYGRDVGNLFISEYVKQLNKTFISESGDIFRMSGSTFCVMITDPRKIDMLDKGILTKSPFMDVQMKYGNIQTELKVHALIKDPEQALIHMRDTLRSLGSPMRPESVLRMYE